MFQLTEFTQATINSVTPRVEKHGDEDQPADGLAAAKAAGTVQ